MQKYIEPYIGSREVAEMIEKNHKDLMRDIKRYIKQMNEANVKYSIERNIAPNEFFQESEYKDSIGRTLPCYNITKKGCEFIAHKLTGTKGTIFTAKYINRFHEMEDIISHQKAKPELPWFIRRFRGNYIMLFRDFETITGVHLAGNYTSLKRDYRLNAGNDYNGWAWYTTVDREDFKKEYGFDYGDDNCMMYLYPCGIMRALKIFAEESKGNTKKDSYKTIMDGLQSLKLGRISKTNETETAISVNEVCIKDIPIQIKIIVDSEIVTNKRQSSIFTNN